VTLPTEIRLLSQRITVELASDLHVPADSPPVGEEGHSHRAHGVYQGAEQAIFISDALGAERQREVFLHENLHAMLSICSLDVVIEDGTPGLSEHLVGILAPVLLDWLRSNPPAYDYLMEGGN
jgi:hypothetical protein